MISSDMHRKKTMLVVLMTLTAFLRVSATPCQIRVSDQLSFDRMDSLIREAVQVDVPEVEVLIDSGSYYYSDFHLALNQLVAPNTQLSIRGNKAVIYPRMEKNPDSFDARSSYYLPEGGHAWRIFSREGEMKMAKFFVRVVDRKKKICKIKIDRNLDAACIKDGYIFITQWYRGRAYKIVDIKGRNVYFYADDLRPKRILFSVNLDWTFSLQFPRYRLINCDQPIPDPVYKGDASTFLSIDGCELAGLSLSGCQFKGNSYTHQADSASLLLIKDSATPVSIRDCSFEHIRTDCIMMEHAHHVEVSNCDFRQCYRYCFMMSHESSDASVSHCTFTDVGKCGDNVFAVICYGRNFRVDHNTFEDYGFGAVATGLHYTLEKKDSVSGVISQNEIYQTPAYNAAAPMNLLMDSGAIYVSTQTDRIVIEDNYIHDVNGPTYNRGIFVDDGASHIRIVNNKVMGTFNHYAIDVDPISSWKLYFRKGGRVVDVTNADNEVYGNEATGKVRVAKPLKRWL